MENFPLDQDFAARDFDKWLDWNGDAGLNVDHDILTEHSNPIYTGQPNNLPMSPSSALGSQNKSSHTQYHTALLTADLPTPSQSSSSPDTRFSIDLRLSGDTLRDEVDLRPTQSLKRRLSSDNVPTNDYTQTTTKPAPKKRPHNIIEKRYRANLNEKIAELRDSVPSLRKTKKSKTTDGDVSSDDEDLDGLTPSNKLNKASILSKAVEYIRHLEFRTKKLEDENRSLKQRIEILDKVISDGGNDAQRASAFTSNSTIEPTPANAENGAQSNTGSTPTGPVRGLMTLPESFQRLRQNMPQEHYGHVYDTPSERPRLGGKWASRVMLGSLAALMLMEGFSESDQGTESREKGLFGIPLELLDGWAFLRSPRVYLAVFSQYCRAGGVLPLIKGFLALTILAFIVFTYLFNSKPRAKKDLERQNMVETQTPAPASPIEVRRRAWSTSMQTLGLPHHTFLEEWIAVTCEWLKYSVLLLFGRQAYLWATGRSIDAETARIKAWDIAIDAQLAGGDPEVSRSRVVLTSFGAGTLPSTPLRWMLKAMHCRVLLWEVGRKGSVSATLADKLAKFLLDREWRKAQHAHERLPARHSDRLPAYLAALLKMDAEDVFLPTVSQRAYNLMYHRPTCEHAEDRLMDVVVEDHAVRSPLDAIAAWRSTCALRQCLEIAAQYPYADELIREQSFVALRIAPPGSAAETRALAVHAVFGGEQRPSAYARALEVMSCGQNSLLTAFDYQCERLPYFIDSSTPQSARPEIKIVPHCAKILLTLDHDKDLAKAVMDFSTAEFDWEHTTILSAGVANFLLCKFVEQRSNVRQSPALYKTTLQLNDAIQGCCDDESALRYAVTQCIQKAIALINMQLDIATRVLPQRRNSSASNDTGYENASGEEGFKV